MYEEGAPLDFDKGSAVRLTAAALSGGRLSPDGATQFLGQMYDALKTLGTVPPQTEAAAAIEAVVSPRDARKSIGKDAITCLICGAKMKVLTKHLREAHGMEPKEYKAKFGLPKTQPLCAKSLTESKRAQAANLNLAQHLADARGKKAEKAKPAKKAATKGQSKPKTTSAAPAAKTPDLGLE